jgi:transposase
MGANRKDISRKLSIPLGTLLSLLNRISKRGLPAIEDRRHRHSHFLPPHNRKEPQIEIIANDTEIILNFGVSEKKVRIPRQNSLQIKVFLLTLVQNGFLSNAKVAKILNYSPTHIARLSNLLRNEDVHALLDKRKGQKKPYLVTTDVKAELIQQFTTNVIVHGTTSSNVISDELKKRCNIKIPARTVRYHMADLGLTRIKYSLPELVAIAKKNSKKSSSN